MRNIYSPGSKRQQFAPQRAARLSAEHLPAAWRDSRIVLTNDTDFLVLAARCARGGESFAPIFFWPQQSRRRVGEIVRRIIREASRNDYAAACSMVHFL